MQALRTGFCWACTALPRAVRRTAGREASLRDARRTAATVLALLEAAPREAMDFVGWSSDAMRMSYQHVTDAMKQRTAKRLNSFLLGEEERQNGATEPESEARRGLLN